MGEYLLLDGRPHKIGTLEDLYYCRYDDLRGWIAACRAARMAGNLPPAEYLDGAFRFRFPFPDEDGVDGALRAALDAYDRGVTVRAPAALFADVEHQAVTKYLRPVGLDMGGVNVFLPCPYGPDIDTVSHSPVGDLRFVQIKQQRPIEGALWTVVGCAFCPALWRLPREQAVLLAECIRADHPHDVNFLELARRIVAGYDEVTR